MTVLRGRVDRVILVAVGVALLIAAALFRQEQAFASTLAVLGLASVVLGVLLPRLSRFSLGPEGLEAEMHRIEERVDEIERNIEVRKGIAELIAQGDEVANSLSLTRDIVLEEMRLQRELTFDRDAIYAVTPAWLDRVRDFLSLAPEVDDADVILFDTHGDLPPIKPKLPDRFDAEIALVRERQQRLRDLVVRL
jgi:hypothetical protein